MKNSNYIISGILGVAIIILFTLQFSGKKAEAVKKPLAIGGDSTMISLPIAYVNVDSLLLNYNYAKDLNETLLTKVESSRASLNQKGNRLQADMLEFQRKYENNAFLSPERAQQEHANLMKRQEDLQQQMERSQQELALEQMKLNQQMTDTVITALKEYNKDKKYQVIFSNVNGTNTILLADQAYNITDEIIVYLNSKYTPVKSSKK